MGSQSDLHPSKHTALGYELGHANSYSQHRGAEGGGCIFPDNYASYTRRWILPAHPAGALSCRVHH